MKFKLMFMAALGVIALLVASCTPVYTVAYGGKYYTGCSGNITPCVNNTFYIGDYKFLTQYDDMQISLANVKTPAANAPTWRYFQGSEVPAFSASQVNVLYFSAQVPHSYLEGSPLELHIHVAYPDNLAGDSTWYYTLSWANIGDVFPVPVMDTISHVPSPATTSSQQMIELVANIDGTGKKISSVLVCSVQRLGNDGDDNYPSEIYGISTDFHYMKNTLGSRTGLAK
jgi:hypothetical protein